MRPSSADTFRSCLGETEDVVDEEEHVLPLGVAEEASPAMGADEVNTFLTHLAVEKTLSASTQNQALSALLFLGHPAGRPPGRRRARNREARDMSHLPALLCHALLERGHDIRTVPELLRDRDVSTTMIYTHVPRHGERGVRSPLDAP
jgi:hypothetical protein